MDWRGRRLKYILVMMEDLSSFTWFKPTESCTAASTAKHLLVWSTFFGVPEAWVSDTAFRFNNCVMETLEGALRVVSGS